VVRGKSRLWTGRAEGAGGTTRKALSDDPAKIEAALSNNIGTNGSLMRSVPLILLYNGCDDIDDMIAAMSRVTHTHSHAIDACSMYAECLIDILHDKNKESVLNGLMAFLDETYSDSYLKQRIAASLADEHLFPVDPGTWPARGTAEFSLYVALWCFKNSTSFADAIEKAVRIGGDTDTYAAITGGLAGAHYGYEAIPLQWRDTCLGRDVMLDYADKLYEMNQRM
jgi:ADP-ribosylglycohydrolase